MNEITAAIRKKAEEKYPSTFVDRIGLELDDKNFSIKREAYTCGGEDAIGFMLKFVEWAFVRGYRPNISELGNLYYHHDSHSNELPEDLLKMYLEDNKL